MNDLNMLTIALSLVAVLFGLLMAVVGWGGNRVIERLDHMVDALGEVSEKLHDRINVIDRRVTVIETRIERRRATDDGVVGDG